MSTKKDRNVALTFQENTQNKPWFSYKYKGKEKAKKQLEETRNKDYDKNRAGPSHNEEHFEENSPSYSPTEEMPNHDIEMVENEGTSGVVPMDTASDVGINSIGAGLKGSNKTGSGARGTVERPSGILNGDHITEYTYTKQYKIRVHTAPIQYKKYNNQSNAIFVKYPYHDIPWHKVGFYLTEFEMRQLQQMGTRVEIEEVEVELFTNTATLPFEIGGTQASVGNNNVGIEGITMHNVRNKRFGYYDRSQGEIIQNIFWGNVPSSLGPATPDYSSVIGPNPPAWLVVRDFDNRFVHYAGGDPALNNPTSTRRTAMWNIDWFPYINFVKERWNASMEEGWRVKEKYVPANKYLFGFNYIDTTYTSFGTAEGDTLNMSTISYLDHMGSRSRINQPGAPTSAETNAQVGWIAGTQALNTTTNGLLFPLSGERYNPIPAINDPEMTATTLSNIEIDSNLTWRDGHNPVKKTTKMPTLTIGLEPLLSRGAEVNTNIDAWMVVFINTKMRVKVYTNPAYLHPRGGIINGQYLPPQFLNPQMEEGRPTDYQQGTSNATRYEKFTTATREVPQTGVPRQQVYVEQIAINPINIVGPSAFTRSKTKAAQILLETEKEKDLDIEEPIVENTNKAAVIRENIERVKRKLNF